ncbi:GGDEF domain-containing protein [Hoeflea sp. YIM 152468]|uniref:GGDEF domain-containing protein n=1 Tax=Hoeflea sp. YIM 152468 TaxID=3031759 RepID=UPI0023DA3406|nr:GGDEF domain-containing protein [Hoeflea sp. YIM 152468]MDF1608288.1 GGDEF domain-containing protein [Hoeflea sp. YIM 152468]
MQKPNISRKHIRTMIRKISIVTVASVLVSLSITATAMILAGMPGAMGLALSIAGLCPLVITPPASYVFFRQTMKLEAAYAALGEAHQRLFEFHLKLADTNRDLLHRASHDSMTGLANRDAFLARLTERMQHPDPGYLLMIDADRFKLVNDMHGHDAGDRALLAVAEAIARAIRNGDFGARIGGEEFAVILNGADREDALRVAERIRSNVEDMSITTAEGKKLKLTVSVGGSELASHASPDEVMRAADAKLYEAKRGGRNRVCVGQRISHAA